MAHLPIDCGLDYGDSQLVPVHAMHGSKRGVEFISAKMKGTCAMSNCEMSICAVTQLHMLFAQ
jgi:hypothetical protein